jgi:hypothetical protein
VAQLSSGRFPWNPRIEHRLWLESPRFLAPVRRRWIVALAATIIYGTGTMIATIFSTPGPYFRSPAFALGAVGIAWVFASIRARARIVDALYEDLHKIYLVDRGTFYSHVGVHFDAICKVGPQLLGALVLSIVNVAAAWLAFYRYPLFVGGAMQPSLRPWAFDPAVYEPLIKWPYFWIVVFFAILISLMVGVTLWLFFRELLLVRSLTALPVVPLANIVRTRLKPLADFHVRAAGDWSLGALSISVLFYRTPDFISVTFISLLVLVAAVVLLIPQLYLAAIVRRAHEKACALALHFYYDLNERNMDGVQKVDYLGNITTITDRPRFWVYSIEELVRWCAAQLIAIIALYIQIASLNRQ